MPPRTSDSHPCSPSWRHDPPPDTGPRTLGASMATEPTPAPASGPELVDTVITGARSEEHTSELQSLMRISYAVFCLKTKHKTNNHNTDIANTTPVYRNTTQTHYILPRQ